MQIISIVNQKGGCGKTTLAVNIASALARMGKETLLLDLDPQAHATYALGHNKRSPKIKTSYDIFRSYIENEKVPYEEILINDREKLSFIPSNMLLSTAEINLGEVPGAATILSQCLADGVFEKYEYVIIDSPPSFGFLTLNSMYAADMILVPIDLSYFSFNAVNSIYRVSGLLNKETGKAPDVFFMLNIFDGRSNFAKSLESDARQRLGQYLLASKVRSSVRLREASRVGKTIFEHDPKSAAALDFYNLTSELISLNKKYMDTVIKEFMLHAPDAGSVYVLGDFNGWKRTESNHMVKLDNGNWTGHFNLPKGKFRYKYLVDGKWMHDPGNRSTEPNIFGSLDSVLEI